MNVTSASLVELLKRYRLLEDTQIAEAENLQSQGTDPITLTGELRDRGWLSPFQVENLLKGKGEALVLGPYVLTEQIGEGGMGQVYKGMHRILKTVRAVKVIHPDCLTSKNAIDRFHREIEMVSRLKHPNIILAHDAGEAGGIHYFIMEYVDGVDLGKLLRQFGPLPVGTACEVIRQAALGLQHAKDRDLVHRDIKPSNILISREDGLVKILDMGLARLRDESAALKSSPDRGPLTPSGAVMGTPDYMAPEQAEDSRTVDTRADIYSLGCSLYQLLTGQLPFPGGSFVDKMIKHRFEQATPITQFRNDVPTEVVVAVDRMMAKTPADRYQSPGEVAEALRPFCKPIDVAALFPGTAGRAATASPGSAVSADSSIPDTLTGSSVMHPSALASMLGSGSGTQGQGVQGSRTNVVGSHGWAATPIPKKSGAPEAPAKPRRRLLFPLLGGGMLAAGLGIGVWLRLTVFSTPDADTSPSGSAPLVQGDTGKTPPTTPDRPVKPTRVVRSLANLKGAGEGRAEPKRVAPPDVAGAERLIPRSEDLLTLEEGVQGVSLSADGARLALNLGPSVRLLDVATGKSAGVIDVKAQVESLPTETRTANLAVLSADGQQVLISTVSRPDAAYMKATRILRTQPCDAVVHWQQGQQRSLFFQGLAGGKDPDPYPRTFVLGFLGPEGKSFVALRPDEAQVWETARPAEPLSTYRPEGRATTLAGSADGKHFLVAAKNLSLCPATGCDARPLAQFAESTDLTALAVAPDNAAVVALDSNGGLRAWAWPKLDGATPDRPVTAQPALAAKPWHKGAGLYLAFSPQRDLLTFASAASDRTVRVGRLRPDETKFMAEVLLAQQFPEDESVQGLVFAPDGESLLVCTSKRLHRLWINPRTFTLAGKQEGSGASSAGQGRPAPEPAGE